MFRHLYKLQSSAFPSVPLAPTVTVRGPATADVSWLPVDGDSIKYDVLQNGIVIISGLTGTSYQSTAGLPGFTTQYTVNAKSSKGGTALSPQTAATFPSLPPVTSVTSSAVSQGAVTLTWPPASGATSYNIYVNTTLVGNSITSPYTTPRLPTGNVVLSVAGVANGIESTRISTTITVYASSGGINIDYGTGVSSYPVIQVDAFQLQAVTFNSDVYVTGLGWDMSGVGGHNRLNASEGIVVNGSMQIIGRSGVVGTTIGGVGYGFNPPPLVRAGQTVYIGACYIRGDVSYFLNRAATLPLHILDANTGVTVTIGTTFGGSSGVRGTYTPYLTYPAGLPSGTNSQKMPISISFTTA